MSRFLFIATHGTDDPARATWPFEMALGAVGEGHQAAVALLGEAVVTMRDEVVSELHGFGTPPLAEIMAGISEHAIPVYV